MSPCPTGFVPMHALSRLLTLNIQNEAEIISLVIATFLNLANLRIR